MYATQADMEARFRNRDLVELTNPDDPAAEVIDAARLTAALEHAGAIADSYALKRYRVPLDPVPPAIAAVVMDLAYHHLHGAMAPDDVKDLHKEAMRYLRDVSEGKARLDVAGAEPASSTDGIRLEGPERVFSKDTMAGF